MGSFFPGMDPFLEEPALWSDFHSRFINSWADALAEVLPEQYDAYLGARVNPDSPRETFIEILHKPDRNLVTVLELLSPANREQPGRTEYLAKRRAILYQMVNLVELDLLRAGRRIPSQVPLPPGDYYYLVARADR